MNFKKTILFSTFVLANLTAFNTAQAMFRADLAPEPMSPRTQGYHDGVDIYLSQFDKNGSTTRRFLRDTNKALGTQAIPVPEDLSENDTAFTQFKEAIAGAVHQLDRVAVRNFVTKANEAISKLQGKDTTRKADAYQLISRVKIATAASESASSAQMLPRSLLTSATSSSQEPVLNLKLDDLDRRTPSFYMDREEEAQYKPLTKAMDIARENEEEATFREMLDIQYAHAARDAADQAWTDYSDQALSFLKSRPMEKMLSSVKRVLQDRIDHVRRVYAEDASFQKLCLDIQSLLESKKSTLSRGDSQHTQFQSAIAEIQTLASSARPNPLPSPKNILMHHFEDPQVSRVLYQLADDILDARARREALCKTRLSDVFSMDWFEAVNEGQAIERAAWLPFIRQVAAYIPRLTAEARLDLYLDLEELLRYSALHGPDLQAEESIAQLRKALRAFPR